MFSPGDILRDRYRLDGQLSHNPQRQTWLAEDVHDGSYVAVKLLPVGGTTRWEDIKLIEREAQILELLHHPHLPQYRDYFALDDTDADRDRGHWFVLVTTYIPGQSLQQQLTQGKHFGIDEIMHILVSVLNILTTLHDRRPPLLHRDIKPSNLIRGENGDIYLIDFGSVQLRPRDLGTSFTVAGTYGYTPIEQFGGQAVPGSDLYALGMTAVHLLSGVAPSKLPQKNLRVQFRDRLPPSCPPGLGRWLERVTAADVAERFPDARSALAALRHPSTLLKVAAGTGSDATQSGIKLLRSSNHLAIEIPSRFSVRWVAPWQDRLRLWTRSLRHRWQTLDLNLAPNAKRRALLGLVIALALGLTIAPGAVIGLVAIGLSLPFRLLSTVLGLVLPVGLIAWLLLLVRGSDYFDSKTLFFNDRHFDLFHRTSFAKQTFRVNLADLGSVRVGPATDGNGRLRSALLITFRDGAIPNLGLNVHMPTTIGTHLSEAELHWLWEEIQSWLDLHRKPLAPKPGHSPGTAGDPPPHA